MELPTTLRADSLDHVVEVLSQAFLKDIFQNYLARSCLGLEDSESISLKHNHDLFSFVLPKFKQQGALFVSAQDAPTVTSVWLPEIPSRPHESNEDDEDPPKPVVELEKIAAPYWQREFPNGQKVLHLILVGNAGTATREKGQKGASFVIREMITAASRAGLPCCLEATSPKARDIYQKVGFEVVKEVIVGKGSADAQGNLSKDGEGFPITLMKYWKDAK